MPEFTYIARDSTGEKITGTMTANTQRDVIAALSGKSLFPVSVDSEAAPRTLQIGGRVSDQKIAVFYEQLASLMSNGVPLLRSLSILRDQTAIENLRLALDDIIARVEDGQELSDGFARHPKVFGDMAVNMSRAGAEGGFLEDALARVATFTEQQADLKAKTLGAMIYPVILATMGSLIVAILVIYFVPKFGTIFEQLRAKGSLPAATEWLLWFSYMTRTYGIFIVIGVVVAYLLARTQLRSDAGKMLIDRLKIRLPLIGPIFQSLAVARFCRVLGTLLRNGVPILKSLDISRDATGNRVLSQAIGEASENITSGESLSVPLSKSGQFPRNVTEMISVAEESNSLDTVLVSIADGLEKQTVRRLDLVVKLIEPLMLMLMAAVVLFVVVALLLPIMKMGETIGQ